MSFKNLQLRYQTAAIMPGPFAHFYTLTLSPAAQNTLQTAISIDYPDREELDEEDIIGEGFTLDDNFDWSGRLPQTWLDRVTAQVKKTRLMPFHEDDLGENDDFFELTLETAEEKTSQGQPADRDSWQYLAQELIQATYEAAGREHPFALTYLDLTQVSNTELRLTASFEKRTLTVETSAGTQPRPLPWDELQRIMSQVYSADYNPEEAILVRPKQDGRFLNLGNEEWYNISDQPALHKLFRNL